MSSDRRNDIFLSFHGCEELIPKQDGHHAKAYTLRDLAKSLLEDEEGEGGIYGGILQQRWVEKMGRKGTLEIFFDDTELTNSSDGLLRENILKGLLQTRGGGVVAILVTKGYFESKWCLTEMLGAIELSKSSHPHWQVRLCFIGLGISVEEIKDKLRDHEQSPDFQFKILPALKRENISSATKKIAHWILCRASGQSYDIVPGPTFTDCRNVLVNEILRKLEGTGDKDELLVELRAVSGDRPLLELARHGNTFLINGLRKFLKGTPPSAQIEECNAMFKAFQNKWPSSIDSETSQDGTLSSVMDWTKRLEKLHESICDRMQPSSGNTNTDVADSTDRAAAVSDSEDASIARRERSIRSVQSETRSSHDVAIRRVAKDWEERVGGIFLGRFEVLESSVVSEPDDTLPVGVLAIATERFHSLLNEFETKTLLAERIRLRRDSVNGVLAEHVVEGDALLYKVSHRTNITVESTRRQLSGDLLYLLNEGGVLAKAFEACRISLDTEGQDFVLSFPSELHLGQLEICSPNDWEAAEQPTMKDCFSSGPGVEGAQKRNEEFARCVLSAGQMYLFRIFSCQRDGIMYMGPYQASCRNCAHFRRATGLLEAVTADPPVIRHQVYEAARILTGAFQGFRTRVADKDPRWRDHQSIVELVLQEVNDATVYGKLSRYKYWLSKLISDQVVSANIRTADIRTMSELCLVPEWNATEIKSMTDCHRSIFGYHEHLQYWDKKCLAFLFVMALQLLIVIVTLKWPRAV